MYGFCYDIYFYFVPVYTISTRRSLEIADNYYFARGHFMNFYTILARLGINELKVKIKLKR
jgi:hypothetical protein